MITSAVKTSGVVSANLPSKAASVARLVKSCKPGVRNPNKQAITDQTTVGYYASKELMRQAMFSNKSVEAELCEEVNDALNSIMTSVDEEVFTKVANPMVKAKANEMKSLWDGIYQGIANNQRVDFSKLKKFKTVEDEFWKLLATCPADKEEVERRLKAFILNRFNYTGKALS